MGRNVHMIYLLIFDIFPEGFLYLRYTRKNPPLSQFLPVGMET